MKIECCHHCEDRHEKMPRTLRNLSNTKDNENSGRCTGREKAKNL